MVGKSFFKHSQFHLGQVRPSLNWCKFHANFLGAFTLSTASSNRMAAAGVSFSNTFSTLNSSAATSLFSETSIRELVWKALAIFYRIFFIYLRFELETQVESRVVYLSFDLYIFALSFVFN